MRRIGLMGGSFNPIHLAHVNLAREALAGGYVDEVIFLPTGNPPHKHAGLADKEDRYEMTRLAIESEEGMRVSRVEVDRVGTIYTVDTLGILREQMPDCRFFYLIGADTLLQLKTWRRIEEVITLCTFLVFGRPGEDEREAQLEAQMWCARGAQIEFMNAQMMDMSSTDVRNRIEQGLSAEDMLLPAVEEYIRIHALYGA